MLVCPETHSELQIADTGILEKLNKAIRAKKCVDRSGEIIEDPIDEALVRASDKNVLYPIRKGIPVLMIERGIPL